MAVFSQMPSMFRLANSGFGSPLNWDNSEKTMPEKIVYKVFIYAIKKVNSKACVDLKCKNLYVYDL